MAVTERLRRIFYGGHGRGTGRATLLTRHLFLPIATIPFLLGLLGLLLIAVVVDPYDIRPWGLAPRLADRHRYPDVEWPLLLKVVTRQHHRLVMIGASTLMGTSTADLAGAFGAGSRPVNLAYPYASPRDTEAVLDAVAAMPSLRRVLFVMDHSQMMGMDERRVPAQLRDQVFASDWAHAGDFRWDTLLASWHRLADGVYDRPEWRDIQQPEFFALITPLSVQPRALTRIRVALAKHRHDVLGNGIDRDCSLYPFFDRTLVPALEKFRRRGVQVDLVFPPYPYLGYYDWIERRTDNDPFLPGPVYPRLEGFKRCTIDVADRFGPGVTVHAVDNDSVITGSVDNYFDYVHIDRPELFRRVLDHVARRDSVLTRSNFSRFDHDLRAHILGYRL